MGVGDLSMEVGGSAQSSHEFTGRKVAQVDGSHSTSSPQSCDEAVLSDLTKQDAVIIYHDLSL